MATSTRSLDNHLAKRIYISPTKIIPMTTTYKPRRKKRYVTVSPEIMRKARALIVKHGLNKTAKRRAKNLVKPLPVMVIFAKNSGVAEVAPFLSALRKQSRGAMSFFVREAVRDAVRKVTG